MIELGPASRDEMVLAFLRAGIGSRRFGPAYRGFMARERLDPVSLIDHPDLSSQQDNQTRQRILNSVRGVDVDDLLRSFPDDVTWRHCVLDQTELKQVRYINNNWPPWHQISGGTRLVGEGARRVADDSKNISPHELVPGSVNNICAVVKDLRLGKRYPALIGVDDLSGGIILVEGHTRATAYAIARVPERIEMIVGYSSNISKWPMF